MPPSPTPRPRPERTDPTPPRAVVGRMSHYLRTLQAELADGRATINSSRLGRLLGFSDSQVRRDFRAFGLAGRPGVGYECADLVDRIRKAMGIGRSWPVALVGCGNLGQALLGYGGFAREGFEIRAAFDRSPRLVGRDIRGIRVEDFGHFAESVRRNRIRLALLAVPAAEAEQTALEIARAGVSGILNFAPVRLNLPAAVSVTHVDLAIELEQLAFAVVRHQKRG